MTDADQQDSNGVINDAGQRNPQGEIADGGQQHPSGGIAGAAQQSPAGEPQEPAANRVYVYAAYAAIGAVLGILVGVAFAANTWRVAGPSGPNDLGPVISNAEGLRGHLVTNWDKKLKYRLVVEPVYPGQHAEFSFAVSNPPRPLSVDIQLKDPAGSVLCGKTIVLKYDPRQAPFLRASDRQPQAGKTGAGNLSTDQTSHAMDVARSEALELEREHGKDIFQNGTGQDGQIESISSHGEIPCSMQAYERTASWSFSPDFPTLDEQADLLKRQADVHADANPSPTDLSAATTASGASKASAPRKRAKYKAPEEPATFAIEGDDELVGYDPSRGIIETRARKTFFIDKTSGEDIAARWQDIPANIHYKCDLTAACTLTRKGAVVLHARLKR